MEIENGSFQSNQKINNSAQFPKEIHGQNNIKKYLNDLFILESLGAGTFGKVMKAWNKTNQRFVAVKITDLIKKKDLRRCQNEVFILKELSALQNPCIPKLYEYFEDDINKQYFIIMELAACNMQNLLEIGIKFNEFQALYILEVLSKTFIQLQLELRIACCDVKPANIIFSQNAMVMLCDFGHAVKLYNNENIIERYYVGSPSYMAPEVRRNYNKFKQVKELSEKNKQQIKLGKIEYDPFQADIYSLAITMLVMIGWALKDIKELIRHKSSQIRKQNIELKSKQQYPYFSEILKSMLSKNAIKRYTWQDVNADIANYHKTLQEQDKNLKILYDQAIFSMKNNIIEQYKIMPIFKNKYMQVNEHQNLICQAIINYQKSFKLKEAIELTYRLKLTYKNVQPDLSIVQEQLKKIKQKISSFGKSQKKQESNLIFIKEYECMNKMYNQIINIEQQFKEEQQINNGNLSKKNIDSIEISNNNSIQEDDQ